VLGILVGVVGLMCFGGGLEWCLCGVAVWWEVVVVGCGDGLGKELVALLGGGSRWRRAARGAAELDWREPVVPYF
jgi:hypothetical protein